MDVPRNLKSSECGLIIAGVCGEKRQEESMKEDAGEEIEESSDERDDSSPISNKRGRHHDEGCNDDTSSSNNSKNNNKNEKKKQRKSNGSSAEGEKAEKVAEKETKNSFAMIIDEAAGGSGSRPGLSLCSSSSPDSRQDRHHVNGRKRSSNSTGEDGEDEESDEDDDDDAAAAPSVFHNNEARGKSDSSLHRLPLLHSSLQIAFSSSSSAEAGGGESVAAMTAATAPAASSHGMDSHHHHAERSDNNSCSSNNSHLMQPSPKKKFKDDLTGEWVCPVCSKKLDSQHTFTVHIRQHNPTDHSHTCSICAKTLSSASSLDRHMLIHSGERPFRCRICNMAFTTNGNMHRHMRTHGSNDLLSDRAGRKSKPLRDTGKPAEKRSLPDDGDSEHSNESGLMESPLSRDLSPSSVSDLSAIGRSAGDLTTTGPGFANTVKTLMNGKFPFPGLGFFDLSFTDFSSQKFPSIAQNFCEHNFRKSTSQFHEFECAKCLRGFPASSALSLHDAVHSATFCGFCRIDLGSPEAFVKHVIQHRIEQGLGLSSDEVSGFLRNNPFSQVNEKEGFMAMLQLHNREADRLASQSQSSMQNRSLSGRRDEGFENASYFVHAKPAAPASKPMSVVDHKTHHEEQQSGTSQHSNEGSNSFDSDAGKHDLADIQSIISVTNSGNHLKQIPAASPSLQSGTEDEESDVRKAACDSAIDSAATTATTAATPESKSGDAGNQEEEGSKESLTCRICAIQFKNPAALKKHSRSHTQGSHNYSCHLCPYTSLDKSTLVRHLRTHNGERPFQCTVCKYAFTTKANCERHVRKRHKKFSKQEIKQLMQYNSELNSHTDPTIIRKTNGDSSLYKSVFGNGTGMKSLLSSGKQVLVDEDSGSLDSQDAPETTCKGCNLNFDTSHGLEKHLRSTNNCSSLNAYVCALCQSGFSSKNSCLRHIRRQHAGADEKLKTILFRGESIAVSSCSSDFSDEESGAISKNGSLHSPSPRLSSSHPISASPSSMNLSHGPTGGSSNNNNIDTHANQRQPHHHHSKLAHENQAEHNSSLAALCHVAKIATSPCKPLNLTSKPDTDDYDAGDEFDENNNDEQPFDLSRGSSRDPHFQPLDLALHALDLSVKASSKPKQSPASSVPLADLTAADLSIDLSARKAADILLTLQSVAARNPFPSHSGLFLPGLSPAQTAMAAALNQSSLLYPSTQQRLLQFQQGLQQAAAAGAAAANSSSKTSASPSCVMSGVGKNERCFTCKICSAGFTLKSNMERHIKRKHVLK